MRMKIGTTMALAATLVVASACGDDEDEATPETTTAETAPTPEEPAAEPEAEAPQPEAPAAGERVDATFENHFPTQLTEIVTAPTGDQELEVGLIKITALDGTSVQRATGGEGERYTVNGAPSEVGAYAHNPAGDSGEDCPTLEATQESLSDAQIVEERRLAASWSGEGPAYGDEIDVLIFQREDQAGFFVRKRFDHGDDYTDFCVATGTPQAPAANTTLEQARAMAGAFVTAREQY